MLELGLVTWWNLKALLTAAFLALASFYIGVFGVPLKLSTAPFMNSFVNSLLTIAYRWPDCL